MQNNDLTFEADLLGITTEEMESLRGADLVLGGSPKREPVVGPSAGRRAI